MDTPKTYVHACTLSWRGTDGVKLVLYVQSDNQNCFYEGFDETMLMFMIRAIILYRKCNTRFGL